MKKKLIWIVVVIAGAGLWAWYDINNRPANERIQSGVQKILRKEPSLRPMYDAAMEDGVLTLSEANRIASKANEMKGR